MKHQDYMFIKGEDDRSFVGTLIDILTVILFFAVMVTFLIGNIAFLVNVRHVNDELKQIKEYASQSEFNSRSCTYKKEK